MTRDRTVAAVAHRDPHTGHVFLDAMRTWSGHPANPVHLQDVEAEVAVLARTFAAPVVFDPYQAALLAQRLHAAGVSVKEYPFTSESRRKLFGVVLQQLLGHHDPGFTLRIYRHVFAQEKSEATLRLVESIFRLSSEPVLSTRTCGNG